MHTPGHVIPAGFHVLIEEKFFCGKVVRREGVVKPVTTKCINWHLRDQFGPATMVVRYKFRIIEDEAKDDARVVRKEKVDA